MWRTKRQRLRGVREGYRSGLEESIAKQLEHCKDIAWTYEKERLKYIPEPRHYTPDFILEGKRYIETKGRFLAKDRTKHLLIQKQYPELDLRFVFTNSRQKLYKGSKTTYAAWCEKHGFLYAERSIPELWMNELTKK